MRLHRGFFLSTKLLDGDFQGFHHARSMSQRGDGAHSAVGRASPIGEGQSEDSETWISVYRAANANGASALICPGGSYSGLALDGEGYPVAEWLANHGITGIVLEY